MKTMKTMTVLTAMAVMILMALAISCATPQDGDSNQPINNWVNVPLEDGYTVMTINFVYDEALANSQPAESLMLENDQATDNESVNENGININDVLKTALAYLGISPEPVPDLELKSIGTDIVGGGNIGINAITPDFPPTYVGLGGDAVNPLCDDPWNLGCLTDISLNCSIGVCNAQVAIPVGTWRTIWFYYAGQIQVAHMSLTSAQATPNQNWLNNFMTINGDALPVTDPLHRSSPAACVRVDRPTATTIEVNRNVAAQTNCQETLLAYELYVIGDSADNRLDDDLLAWTGVNTNDGDMKLKSTLLPSTVISGSILFPRMLWNTAATPQPAYTHRFASVTSGQSLWFAVYSHDRGAASLPGQISTIKGGDYVRTYVYNTTTHTFATVPTCGGSGFGVELVNMLNLNYLLPTDPFYILQIQGTTPATGCPIQGADTRPVIFGFGT